MARWLSNLRSRPFVAVDYDRRHLRIIQAECVAGKARILRLIEVPLPEEVDLSDADGLGTLLGEALRKHKLGGAGVLMNVPRTEAVLKPLTLPPGTSVEEMPGMVRFQMEKELPFQLDEAVIDFTVSRHYDAEAGTETADADGVDVLVAAVRVGVVEHYRRIAAAAKVRLLRLGLRPYAVHHCVEACVGQAAGQRIAVVSINSDETEIDVIDDGVLAFSRSAKVAVPAGAVGTDPSVNLAVMEVARSLQSYQSVDRSSRISAVLVAGGTGIERAVAAECQRRLGVRSEPFDPTQSLQMKVTDEQAQTSAFIAAIGLAVGHAHADELPFDFQHPKEPVVPRDNSSVRNALIAVLLITLVVGGGVVGWLKFSQRKDQIEQLVRQKNQQETLAKKTERYGERVEAIQQWEQSSRDWVDHLAYLSVLLPPADQAYIDEFRTHADGWIKFRVFATRSDEIDRFYQRLIQAGYRVKPHGTKPRTGNHGRYAYVADFQVIVPEDMKIGLAGLPKVGRPADDQYQYGGGR